MYEKYRESNALAAISRDVAAAQAHPTSSENVDIKAEKQKKKEKTEKKRPRRLIEDDSGDQHQKNNSDAEMQKNIIAPEMEDHHDNDTSQPSQDDSIAAYDAFDEWFLLQMAEAFDNEIEQLSSSSAKILMRAFSSHIVLFNDTEKKAAVS